MRENQPTPEHPKGKPKGFGFLSFKRHEEALNVLRKLNNNPEVFSANHVRNFENLKIRFI